MQVLKSNLDGEEVIRIYVIKSTAGLSFVFTKPTSVSADITTIKLPSGVHQGDLIWSVVIGSPVLVAGLKPRDILYNYINDQPQLEANSLEI